MLGGQLSLTNGRMDARSRAGCHVHKVSRNLGRVVQSQRGVSIITSCSALDARAIPPYVPKLLLDDN